MRGVKKAPLSIVQILEKNEFNTGSVHQMYQAARGLRERGHRVTIVSREAKELREKAAAADVDFVALPFRSDFDPVTIRGIRRIADEKSVDVIHVHKGRSHTLALMATWRRPVSAFVVNRGVSFPLTMFNRTKYRTARVDAIVTVCQQIKDVIVASGKVPDAKVHVVYAGTDLRLFDPSRFGRNEFRAEKKIPHDAYLFAQVGVRDWKGWRELIDAFSDIAPRHPNAMVVLIATKNAQDERDIRDYANAARVGDRVLAVEYRSDVPRVFSAMDCVVDASWAGTGITGTIREAMALAKPTISTDCGGNVELVSSPKFGWLVPAKDRAALARAMEEVISDPDRAGAVGAAARLHVIDGFSMEKRIDHLEALYYGIVEKKKLKIEN